MNNLTRYVLCRHTVSKPWEWCFLNTLGLVLTVIVIVAALL